MRFSRGLSVVLLSFSAAISAGCSKDTPRLPVARRHSTVDAKPDSDVLRAVGLQYYWENPRGLPLRPGEWINELYLRDENLYLVSDRNDVYACDAQMGIYKWRVNVGPAREALYPPVNISETRLPPEVGSAEMVISPPIMSGFPAFPASVFTTGNRLTLVNRDSGRVYRQYLFDGFSSSAQPAVDPGALYFYAATAIRRLQRVNLLCEVRTTTVDIDGLVNAPLKIFGDGVYLGSRNGLIMCVSRNVDLSRKWTLRLRGAVLREFHVDEKGLFVMCEDQHFYGIDPVTGGNLYPAIFLEGRPAAAMQMGPRSVFQRITGRGLYAIDFQKGTVRWRIPAGVTVVGATNTEVWILDTSGNLLIVDEMTGTLKKSISYRGFDYYAANARVPAVYTATKDGKFFCLSRKEEGHITLEMLKAMKKKKEEKAP